MCCDNVVHVNNSILGAYKENHYAQYSKENRRAQKIIKKI